MPTFADITADDFHPSILEHGTVPRRLAALEEASRGLERIHRREITRRRLREHRRTHGFGVDPTDRPEGVWAWRSRLTLEKAAPVRSSLAMLLLVRAEQGSRILPCPARNLLDEFLSEVGYAIRFTEAEGSFRNSRGTFGPDDLPSLRAVRTILERWRREASAAMEADHA